jgi:carbamoyltransferase
VRDIDAKKVFVISDSQYNACKFMTITTDVHQEYQEKIPAVVHVDNTARPQVITREDNYLYYDVLTQFEALTGLPVLINTSFNAHEEPIVNTPQEALQELYDDRIDFLIFEGFIVLSKKVSVE